MTTLQQPLQVPIVSCPLGKLYNKESIISYLLSSPGASPFGHEGDLIASHIRNFRDLTTLALTPNPSLASDPTALDPSNNLGSAESHPAALFVCPLSLREMNGSVRFVYRRPGGTVVSESSLKEMRRGGGEVDTRVDPVTGARDGEGEGEEEWVTLNPKGEEMDMMKVSWEARKIKEAQDKKAAKASKGDKKRKAVKDKDPSAAADATATAAGATDEIDSGPAKKKKLTLKEATSTPTGLEPSIHAGSSIPRLSATLAAALAEKKKTQSAAVQSLYAPKDRDMNHDKDGRSTWMTRGAFTRYA